jgi:hypothetical protein
MVSLLLPSDDRGGAKLETKAIVQKRETLSGRARRERVSRDDDLLTQPQKPPIAPIRRRPMR